MNGSEHEPRQSGSDRIENLLRKAAARERPSAADEQVIREAVRAEWLAATHRDRWRRAGWAAAGMAAMLVLALIVLQRSPPTQTRTPPGERLAEVEAVTGGGRIVAGAEVRAGQEIATATARLALRWRDGSSLRIDENTKLRLNADGAVELASGRVYVDAATSTSATTAPVILTPAGPVRHLGTQYMVGVVGVSVVGAGANGSARDGAATRISVREGLVALTADDAQHTAGAGQELDIGPDGRFSLLPIPAWGELWQWADALAAPFDANGRSLADFLDWVAHETGRRVEFASAAAEQRARATELRGAIELEPMRALELVLQTSDLLASVDNGVIKVSLRKAH